MRIDLGGIAKLYIIEAGAKALERQGVARALVNGGGDVACFGAMPWRIAVRDPRAPDTLIGVLSIERGIVASSGDYERYFERDGRRYHHILDPRTGYPSTGVRGVTLVSERLDVVSQGLGEMKSLASGVGDLKKVLTNIKTRGLFGEVQEGSPVLLKTPLIGPQESPDKGHQSHIRPETLLLVHGF